MKTIIKNEKIFEAVWMMREIRGQISVKIQDMNFDESRAYIKSQLVKSTKKWLDSGNCKSLLQFFV